MKEIKKHYEKPTCKVYLLQARQQLLQSSVPIYSGDTPDQW